MSDLVFYKALSAILYLCVALMYYRKVDKLIKGEKKQELEKIRIEVGLEDGMMKDVPAFLLAVLCLFWPVTAVFSAYRKAVNNEPKS